MTDTDLLQRFEKATLSADDFPHSAHVRLAWIYLSDRPLLEVLDRYPRHLERLAAALGADGLYHETITWFFLLLVHDRIARSEPCQTWASFEAANPDLLGSSAELMNRFYDESTWRSDTARKTFLLPDRGTRPRS